MRTAARAALTDSDRTSVSKPKPLTPQPEVSASELMITSPLSWRHSDKRRSGRRRYRFDRASNPKVSLLPFLIAPFVPKEIALCLTMGYKNTGIFRQIALEEYH
jgi:hypothetical protein